MTDHDVLRRRRAVFVIALLVFATFLCGCLAVWAAATNFKAKQCLDGQLYPHSEGASITEQGCEITTTSGQTILVRISGPSFEVGVGAVLGFVGLVVVLVVFCLRYRGAFRGL